MTYYNIAPVPGDIVYGDTTADRLAYLNSNDDHLNTVYAIEGRRDYAVASHNATFYDLIEYRLIRRGDILNYLVNTCTLEATGVTAVTLNDDDVDLPACGYHTLDLNGVDGLGYGMQYRIVPGGGGTLSWAEESD